MYMEWTGMELWIDKHYGCISHCHSQAHTPLDQISLRTNHNCNSFSIYPFGAGIWLPKLDIHAGWFFHTFINCLRIKFECRNHQWQLNLQEHCYYMLLHMHIILLLNNLVHFTTFPIEFFRPISHLLWRVCGLESGTLWLWHNLRPWGLQNVMVESCFVSTSTDGSSHLRIN